MSRFFRWWITDNGKLTACYASGAAVVASFLPYYLPNTLFINKYKDFVHLYSNGMPVEIPNDLKLKFEKALELADIPESKVKYFEPFHVFGFEPFNAGTDYSKFGCIIGLPIHFTYNRKEDVRKENIKLLGNSIPWATEEANDFLNSLILSEKAQIYAIAREVKMAESSALVVKSLLPPSAIMMTYILTSTWNKRLNFYAKPLSFRVVFYSLVSILMTMNCLFFTDLIQNNSEKEVDEFLKYKDPILAEGGKEFYEKALKRNVALRKLLGKEGPNNFTVTGNENYKIRQKHIPLKERKEYFEDKETTTDLL